MISLRNALLIFVAVGLAACGGGGSSTDSVDIRTVTGSLSGDLSAVSNVVATRTSDGKQYQATLATARMTELASSTTFSVSVPVGASYQLSVIGANSVNVATIMFSSSPSSGSTNVFNVSGNSTKSLGIGNVTVPTGASEENQVVAYSDHSPLKDNDHDGDGHNDYDDDDDDNDGYRDDDDDDDYDDNYNGHEDDGNDDSHDDGNDNSQGDGNDDSHDDGNDDSHDDGNDNKNDDD